MQTMKTYREVEV